MKKTEFIYAHTQRSALKHLQEHINRIKTRFIIFKQPQSNLKATSKHVHIRKKHNYNYSIPYFAVLLIKKKNINNNNNGKCNRFSNLLPHGIVEINKF